MKQYKSENPVSMLAALGFALAIIGSQGAWLNLPLSGSSPDLMGELASHVKMIDLFRWFFLITIFLAGVSSVFQYRRISVQMTFFSVLIIVGFIIYGLFQNQQLLVSYMAQSEEYFVLQNFISKHYWPNINPDYTVSLISEYEYLWQRLLLSWNILGIGCKTAFLGAIILFISNVINVRLPKSVYIVSGVILIAWMLILLTPLIRAEVLHRQGDALLDSGHHRQALEVYSEALRLDPMLEYSAPFLIKVSRLYYRLEGEESAFSGLYLLHSAVSGIAGRRLKSGFLEQLKQAHLAVNNIDVNDAKGTMLQNALIRQSHIKKTSAWVSQGLLEYENGRQIDSVQSFKEALKEDGSIVHAKFFMAHVLLELKRRNDALALLKSALQSVGSKQLRADFLCTVGEAYGRLDQPLLARQAYTSCYELDTVYNYRAVLHLGGT